MGLTVTTTPGKVFAETEAITNPALNQLGSPSFNVTGTVGAAEITDASVTGTETIASNHFYTASVTFSAGDYTLTLPGSPSVIDGMVVAFKANANGVPNAVTGIRLVIGASTKKLFKNKTEAMLLGDIVTNQIIEARYDTAGDGGAGAWQMTSHLSNVDDVYVATVGGTANAITLTVTPPASTVFTLADIAGKIIRFKVLSANTGPVTLAVTIGGTTLAATALYRNFNVPLALGDLKVNQIVEATYETTSNAYQMQSQNGSVPVEYAATDTGAAGATTTTVVILPTAGYTAYNQITGKSLVVVPGATNVGTTTLTVGGVATPPTIYREGRPIISGEISSGKPTELIYDGSNVQLLTPPAPSLCKAWFKADATGTDKTITNSLPGSDQQTVTGHGITAATNLTNVQAGSVRNSAGALPTGLAINTIYYLRVVDANTLTFHTTQAGVLTNTNRVAISGAGTGTNTLHYNPLRAAYNVTGLMSRSSGANLVDGDLEVYFTQAFGSGHYVLFGTVLQGGAGNTHAGSVSVHASDTGSASFKRIFVEYSDGTDGNAAGTGLNEMHLVAFGLQ